VHGFHNWREFRENSFASLRWNGCFIFVIDTILRITTGDEYRIKESEGTAEAGRIIEREMRAIVNNVNGIKR